MADTIDREVTKDTQLKEKLALLMDENNANKDIVIFDEVRNIIDDRTALI